MPFSRYLFSLIKVSIKVVCIYSRLRVSCTRNWQNVETKFVGTEKLRIKNNFRRKHSIIAFTIKTTKISRLRRLKKRNFSLHHHKLYINDDFTLGFWMGLSWSFLEQLHFKNLLCQFPISPPPPSLRGISNVIILIFHLYFFITWTPSSH